ncbi:SGNH hydrolase-type esterase domain-containing protein [Boletus edulis BED1]|uniref:SGNH hydrolase-type esterase domain-containing protein n=1 Tax=Boletus edulis BED1 TaxID=1328754 RepID=A0AAD4GE95_BOLED|nr:SGNH hydrolase-type esterase domain-containing protein [Boletus edulis BED1]
MIAITFSGNQSIIIPNGAQVVSDPIYYQLEAQSVTVDLYTERGQQGFYITSHPGSRTTSWYSYSFGNYVLRVVVIVCDSITDGRGSDTDGNDRWPDLVLQRMQENPFTANIAVLNQAAGGNRILYDGLGPNGLGRIDRDILVQSGIKYIMIFEGVNDIGTAPATPAAQQMVSDRLIQASQHIIARVHTFGLPIFAATITPFGAPNDTIKPYSDPLREQTRVRINDWIMKSGAFDGVIDFASIVANPTNPTQLNPAYNSGDFLHPNLGGMRRLRARSRESSLSGLRWA